MFTGIVAAVGQVKCLSDTETGKRLDIAVSDFDLQRTQLGDSIAVNGVCLTVTAFDQSGFSVDVSAETLNCTTLGQLGEDARLNLEHALTLNSLVGGHLVSGHVDAVGHVRGRTLQADAMHLSIEVPVELGKYISRKGSVCVDGVSLTVNAVSGSQFELLIIPHTLRRTILGEYRVGSAVNIEVDLLARYIERLLAAGVGTAAQPQRITREFLDQHGYLAGTDRTRGG